MENKVRSSTGVSGFPKKSKLFWCQKLPTEEDQQKRNRASVGECFSYYVFAKGTYFKAPTVTIILLFLLGKKNMFQSIFPVIVSWIRFWKLKKEQFKIPKPQLFSGWVYYFILQTKAKCICRETHSISNHELFFTDNVGWRLRASCKSYDIWPSSLPVPPSRERCWASFGNTWT